jgi:hypothetical protein
LQMRVESQHCKNERPTTPPRSATTFAREKSMPQRWERNLLPERCPSLHEKSSQLRRPATSEKVSSDRPPVRPVCPFEHSR